MSWRSSEVNGGSREKLLDHEEQYDPDLDFNSREVQVVPEVVSNQYVIFEIESSGGWVEGDQSARTLARIYL